MDKTSLQHSRVSKEGAFKLHSALVIVQFCFAGFEILTRAALFDGANQLIFTFYRNILAVLVLGPAAYFLERKQRPVLNFSTILMLFLLGLLGVTINQMCYLLGLEYTSTVFASAMRNLTPMFTFVLAAILRVEEVNIKRRDGLAKVFGTLLGLSGAVLLSLYHGPAAADTPLAAYYNEESQPQLLGIQLLQISKWQLGVICLVLSFLSFSLFLIFQSIMLERYPAPVSIGAYSCLFSMLQLGALAAVFERKVSSWRLTNPTELLSVLYAGLIGSGFVSGVQSWGVQKGGPVLVAAYQPLETVAVTIFYVFSGETVLLASAIGTALVIAGLYLLTWGQEQQRKQKCLAELNENEANQSILEQPLLHDIA